MKTFINRSWLSNDPPLARIRERKICKYFLIGIPNCGKSTLGRRTAEILHLPFYDTDSLVRDKLPIRSPADIFRFSFTGRFLTEQHKVVAELIKLDGSAIIATGAEVALMPECAKLIRSNGTVIHIRRKPELVLADLQNNDKSRFVLHNVTSGKEIDMQEEAVSLYTQEYNQYEAVAHLTLENNGNEDEGVDKLVAMIDHFSHLNHFFK
jgi:shikimate kinase